MGSMNICSAVPYEGNEPFIFFSYCHRDAAQAYPILERLSMEGYRVWHDGGIRPGVNWAEDIAVHESQATVVLAIVSENATGSHNCRNELTFAVNENKKLLAVLLERFPMSLGTKLQLASSQQTRKYEFEREEDFYSTLIGADCIAACRTSSGRPGPEELERWREKWSGVQAADIQVSDEPEKDILSELVEHLVQGEQIVEEPQISLSKEKQSGNMQASAPEKQSGNAHASAPEKQEGNAQTSAPEEKNENEQEKPVRVMPPESTPAEEKESVRQLRQEQEKAACAVQECERLSEQEATELEKLEKEWQDAQTQYHPLEEQCQTLETQWKALEAQWKTLVNQLQSLKTRLQELNISIEQSQTAAENRKTELKDLRAWKTAVDEKLAAAELAETSSREPDSTVLITGGDEEQTLPADVTLNGGITFEDGTIRIKKTIQPKSLLIRLFTGENWWIKSVETFLGNQDADINLKDIGEVDVNLASYQGRFCLIPRDGNRCPIKVGSSVLGPRETKNLYSYDVFFLGDEPFLLVGDKDVEAFRMNPMLQLVMSVRTGEVQLIQEEPLLLGRSYAWAHDVLSDRGISRKHARVYLQDGKAYLMDTMSKNGVIMAGEYIPKETPVALRHNDVFQLPGERDNYDFRFISPEIHLKEQ